MKAVRKAIIGELTARLEGSRKSGLRLTAAECARYADALRPKRRGRPPDNVWIRFGRQVSRDEIGIACVAREREGASVKDAIAATANEYRVSESTVRDRRRKYRIRPGRQKPTNK